MPWSMTCLIEQPCTNNASLRGTSTQQTPANWTPVGVERRAPSVTVKIHTLAPDIAKPRKVDCMNVEFSKYSKSLTKPITPTHAGFSCIFLSSAATLDVTVLEFRCMRSCSGSHEHSHPRRSSCSRKSPPWRPQPLGLRPAQRRRHQLAYHLLAPSP